MTGGCKGGRIMRWLRHWREWDDRRPVKGTTFVPDINPIGELGRILGEANANNLEEKSQRREGRASARR
jgi:hypothetical protein